MIPGIYDPRNYDYEPDSFGNEPDWEEMSISTSDLDDAEILMEMGVQSTTM